MTWSPTPNRSTMIFFIGLFKPLVPSAWSCSKILQVLWFRSYRTRASLTTSMTSPGSTQPTFRSSRKTLEHSRFAICVAWVVTQHLHVSLKDRYSTKTGLTLMFLRATVTSRLRTKRPTICPATRLNSRGLKLWSRRMLSVKDDSWKLSWLSGELKTLDVFDGYWT